MIQITDHAVNPANEALKIEVRDQPGSGGAFHKYAVLLPEGSPIMEMLLDENGVLICFQKGPIAEAGVNGLTQEALIAICIHRLRSFQAGPFACRENALALTKLEEAQMWLLKRTRDRMARGVEGTHQT